MVNILQYIAAESIMTARMSGWTWKYDPHAFRDLQPSSIFSLLQNDDQPDTDYSGPGQQNT